jgi:hypothetical protein
MKLAAPRRILPAGLLALVFVVLALLAPAVGRAGGAPVLTFNLSSYNFGTLTPNTTASQTFTLTNSGGKGTGRLTLALSGSAAFSITAETCTSLGPRKSCTVTVTYAPAAGASDSATLSATSKKTPRSATVSLTGTSKSASQLLCESIGGTFALGGPAPWYLWTCNGWLARNKADLDAKHAALAQACFAEGGQVLASGYNPPFPTTIETDCTRFVTPLKAVAFSHSKVTRGAP